MTVKNQNRTCTVRRQMSREGYKEFIRDQRFKFAESIRVFETASLLKKQESDAGIIARQMMSLLSSLFRKFRFALSACSVRTKVVSPPFSSNVSNLLNSCLASLPGPLSFFF